MADSSEATAPSNVRKVVEAVSADGRGMELFARELLDSTDAASLEECDATALTQEVRAGFAALEHRERGQHRIGMRPSSLVDGGVVLEIVNDDMPFLLDSIMGEVQARGLDARLVMHPIFKVDRTDDGALVAVAGRPDTAWGDGRQESYIVVHIAPGRGGQMSQSRQDELAAGIGSILDDVRSVVADWRPMLVRLGQAIEELAVAPVRVSRDELTEQLAFLGWLVEGNFTFLGLRDFVLDGPMESGNLVSKDDAGLGLLADPDVHVLRRESQLVALTPEVRQFLAAPDPIIIAKANVTSRVHRRAHMDYIGIKHYGPGGEVTGELRIVGLFTSSAYTQSPRSIPILRRKTQSLMADLNVPADSHAGKVLANVIDTFPRDELFQIDSEDLAVWVRGILDLDLRPRVRVFVRFDPFDRFASTLVYLPRDRFSTAVRVRIGEYLAEAFGGYIAAFYPQFAEGPLVRVHYIVARRAGELPHRAARDLEAGVIGIVRTWSDELDEALAQVARAGQPIKGLYARAFPPGYVDSFPPERAIEDIIRIERLDDTRPVGIDMHRGDGGSEARMRAAIYCLDGPIRLSQRVPLLEHLGFSVIDERTFELSPRFDGKVRAVVLHEMLLETLDGEPLSADETLDVRLEETFVAVLDGRVESDRFNRLVTAAGLDWRQASVVRAGAGYLRQLGSGFDPFYMAETLARHPRVVRDLVQLFHVRFAPEAELELAAREAQAEPIRARIEAALAEVESLDEDRILRQLLSVLVATVRTNFYQRQEDGGLPGTLAFKIDTRNIELAPEPRPYREIYVASPRVEGVHLRFAPIARGGIRWSDRAQDYRTEVLGLAKAQQVKNAVIVPAGAKGGFYPKALPRGGSREEIQAEGVRAYSTFVAAMLDITDNIVDGKVLPPPGVVRHDGDDPYLVVAADKGTATFSDTANAIATGRGFWLGDAFASGGSAGYDHKGMGITARGAWECVKRHFREMDRDIQTQAFTAIGVGDMSGDVFGNGMLLSPATRLVAAFDHRDIFLDPDPDPETSLAERRRLFDMGRSSWADYDRAAISAGGGVYSRASKSVTLSPQVQGLLGVDAEAMTPTELMRAILKAEADLLWFGGIGTYVRASAETDADVGDRANDGIRVSAQELRVRVIGEGANLGMTQRGRVEAADRGVRLNTDFIDNSAGVNTSDQEVNIKIALGPAVADGRLALDGRNALLSAMTEDVAAAVLRNNYQQSLALSLAERRKTREMGAIARLIRELAARGLLDRQLEALPDDHVLAERNRLGLGLARPELAVLMSYTKIALLHDLLATAIPDDPYLAGILADYFPRAMRNAYAAEISQHRLRREIVATTLTNGIVNRLGLATPLAIADATGRPITDVAAGFVAVRQAFDLPALWSRIDALDTGIAGQVQLGLYGRVQRALIEATTVLVREGIAELALGEAGARLAAGCEAIAAVTAGGVPGPVARRLEAVELGLCETGVPPELAADLARLEVMAKAPAIIATAERAGREVGAAARVQFGLAAMLWVDGIVERAEDLSPGDDFERLAIGGSLAGISEALGRIAVAYLTTGADIGEGPMEAWIGQAGPLAARAREDLQTIAEGQEMSVARLTVAASRLVALAQAVEATGG